MTLVPKAVVASVLPFFFYNKIYKFILFGHNFVCLILLVSRGYWPKRKAYRQNRRANWYSTGVIGSAKTLFQYYNIIPCYNIAIKYQSIIIIVLCNIQVNKFFLYTVIVVCTFKFYFYIIVYKLSQFRK